MWSYLQFRFVSFSRLQKLWKSCFLGGFFLLLLYSFLIKWRLFPKIHFCSFVKALKISFRQFTEKFWLKVEQLKGNPFLESLLDIFLFSKDVTFGRRSPLEQFLNHTLHGTLSCSGTRKMSGKAALYQQKQLFLPQCSDVQTENEPRLKPILPEQKETQQTVVSTCQSVALVVWFSSTPASTRSGHQEWL